MADLPKPKPKVLLLLPLLILLLANMKVHSADSTYFAFDTFEPYPSDLIYQGDAHVPSGFSFLSLINTSSSGVPQPNSVGRVLYSPPVLFWDALRQATFDTTLIFNITPLPSKQVADGLAFFIAPVNTIIPVGAEPGNLGIYGTSGTVKSLFSVEYDVFVNFWDPSYTHVGININSRNSSAVTKFDEGGLGQLVTANINYFPKTRKITVTTEYGSTNSTLSYVYHLKDILPQRVRVGVSATTGASSLANFDLVSWYFSSTLIATANNDDNGEELIQQIV
ncbi:agglutinin-2-like [Henckelia pumila]|uniref:agglutinin-2-like n=1 Tax=Henckelia pumila TaxID=405737 RepID=UPI003C6E64FD